MEWLIIRAALGFHFIGFRIEQLTSGSTTPDQITTTAQVDYIFNDKGTIQDLSGNGNDGTPSGTFNTVAELKQDTTAGAGAGFQSVSVV